MWQANKDGGAQDNIETPVDNIDTLLTKVAVDNIETLLTKVADIGFFELLPKRCDEGDVGPDRQIMLSQHAFDGIAMWTKHMGWKGENTKSEIQNQQPITPMMLPLRGVASLDMLYVCVGLCETLDTTDLFESDVGIYCLQFVLEKVGQKAHLVMLLAYLCFLVLCSFSVFSFQSLLERKSFETHAVDWAQQIAVLILMVLYVIKQLITSFHLKDQSILSFLFGHVWNIMDFISFFLVTCGIMRIIKAYLQI